MPQTSATEFANIVGGELRGDGGAELRGVASLDDAMRTDVAFLGNKAYTDNVAQSRAGAVLLPRGWDGAPPSDGQAHILCDDPSTAFNVAVERFTPPPPVPPPGIHPTAAVAESAKVDPTAHIGANAVVEDGAEIGPRSVVGAGCVLGADTTLGADCLIHPNVTILHRCQVGSRVVIHSGTVIGSDGFGFIPGQDGHTKIPQRGIVRINDDVEIGAQVAIDRARFGETRIGQGTKIDNLVQIAHNVVVGKHCFLVAQSGISGSTTLGDFVTVAGQVGIAGHLDIGDGAVLMAQSGVSKNVPPGASLMGTPAVERREFARRLSAPKQIQRLRDQLDQLQSDIGK